jgi:talin
MGDCKTMADHIPSLVEGVKGTLSNPENPAAQLNLINASEQFLQVSEWPSGHMFQYGKRAWPMNADVSKDCSEC